jgi:hypothetical protein
MGVKEVNRITAIFNPIINARTQDTLDNWIVVIKPSSNI